MAKPPVARELLDVVVRLSFARSIEAVAEVVRQCARDLTGADGVTFVLREGDQCYYADEDAIAPLWKGRRFPLASCISGWVVCNRQPVSIPDIYQDPRIPIGVYRPTFVKSLAMVPIRHEDPIGAIGAYWAEVEKPGERELETLQALADACALAVANVELYGELQQTLESERAARRAAEEASRLKDEFLATLSHELRTPLHIMQGWLWQLRQADVSPRMLQRGLEVVERNAHAQARLVDDLLDVSRAVCGKLRIDLRPVNLADVCRAAVETAAPAAEAKRIGVRLELPDERIIVRADPERLSQILWNLVSNSIKFTAPGGTVGLSVRRENASVRVEVKDDGIGIDPAFLPHAFDPFRQADSGTTRQYGGLGLGLSIVRQLTQLHGGTVTAVSRGSGQGTTVILELPMPGEAEEAAAS